MIWFLLSCTEDTQSYKDITSREEVDVVEDTGTADTADTAETGTVDTADTGTSSTTVYEMTFHAPSMTCSDVKLRTMTLTSMMPGSLDTEDASEAEFSREVDRISLGSTDSNIEFSSTSDDMDDCIFSIPLPTPTDADFSDIIVGEESNGSPSTVSIAIYYPATFVGLTPVCTPQTLTETNTDKVSCDLTFDLPTTPDPTTEVVDAQLVNADIYDWGSDTLPVYVDDYPEGAFEDLGFEQGWNLAQFEQGEIVLVEPLDNVDQLAQVELDNSAFIPRYQVNGLGSISVEDDFGDEFSVDLLPVQWFNESSSVSTTGNAIYYQDSDIAWSIEVYDRPSSDQFFGLSFPTESYYYEQWSSFVDAAVFVPLVFTGTPMQYESGVPQTTDASDIAITDSRLGAVCKDSSTLAFIFLDEPRTPSKVYWYNLIGYNPGWHAIYGTDNDPDSWRMVLENTDVSSSYTYSSLSVGNSCQVPEGWQLPEDSEDSDE